MSPESATIIALHRVERLAPVFASVPPGGYSNTRDLVATHHVQEPPTIKLQQGCGLRFGELVASDELHHKCLTAPTRGTGFLPTKAIEPFFRRLDFKAFIRHGMALLCMCCVVFVRISSGWGRGGD
jgi:hypothetical protein